MDEMELMEALAECLEALRRSEADLEACLERHAAYRAELEPLLEVARLIPRLPGEIAPSPPFRQRARRLILDDPNGENSTAWCWQRPR